MIENLYTHLPFPPFLVSFPFPSKQYHYSYKIYIVEMII